MSDFDPEGQIFLSVPHTYDRFFFLHTFNSESGYLIMQSLQLQMSALLWWLRLVTSLRSVSSTLKIAYRDVLYNQCISNTWRFLIFIFPTGQIGVCEIRFASTGVLAEILIRYARKLDTCLIFSRKRVWQFMEIFFLGDILSNHIFRGNYLPEFLLKFLSHALFLEIVELCLKKSSTRLRTCTL